MKKQRKQRVNYYSNLSKDIKEVLQLFAKVDPDFLSKISPILNRDISTESIKDTEDYNMSVVSRHVDRGVRLLMEAGLPRTQSLDLIKVINDHLRYLGEDESRMKELQDILNDQKFDYKKFPFLHQIESDIRAYFILKTNKSDKYSTLFKELDELMPSFMKQEEWDFLKDCINRGNKRLLETDLVFPLPVEGEEQGIKINVDEEGQKKYLLQYDESFYFDKRKDGPDMLALKELVNILKGEDVHPLTIGPGFFLKYLPEIRYRNLQKDGVESIYPYEKGRGINSDKSYWWNSFDEEYIQSIPASFDQSKDWDGIVFKVNEKTNKLESICLSKTPDPMVIKDGATMASLLLYYSQIYETKREWIKRTALIEDNPKARTIKMDEFFTLKRKDGVARYKENMRKNISGNVVLFKDEIKLDRSTDLASFMNGYKYYVVADSQVSGPKSQFPYLNESISFNNQIIDAGECYLFENNNDTKNSYLATRLYFYPYFPEYINPMLQHGSVIFGSNDQSFHPCLRSPIAKQHSEHNTQLTRDICKPTLKDNMLGDFLPIKKLEKKSFNHESNSLIARMMFMQKEDGSFDNNSHIIHLTNPDKYIEHSRLHRWEFDFSPRMFLSSWGAFNYNHYIYDTEDKVVFNVLCPLLEHFLSFNQRFSILKYADNFSGITEEKQLTFLEVLAKESEAENNISSFLMVQKLKEVTKIAKEQNISFDEALVVFEKQSK